MPPSDFRLPDDFPDLSLGERANKPPETSQPPAASGAPTGWRVGDRVLAPWEPQFLYAGRVAELQADKALVQFDDGDSGWVPLDLLRPLAMPVGQKVLSRKRMGQTFLPGEVREVRGDEVRVAFADGETEWTRVGALRIPCQPRGGATPTQVASHMAFLQHLRPGDRVWAPWTSDMLYPGSVEQLTDKEAHIRFDDGGQGWVLLEQLVPLQIPVGLRVLARWRMGKQYAPATVAEVEGDRIYLRFDDGNTEWSSAAALALPCKPFGPNARPTHLAAHEQAPTGAGGGGGGWSWVGPAIVVSIILALMRMGCR
jgi:hypothetical protein